MTAFQRILINTERWNETVVTPSLAKPHELICTPNTYISLLGRYNVTCSPVECWKTTVLTGTRPKNRLLWILALSFSVRPFTGDAVREILNKQFLGLRFGVLHWRYGTPLQKRELRLAILTRTRTYQDIKFLSTECHVQNKRKKIFKNGLRFI